MLFNENFVTHFIRQQFFTVKPNTVHLLLSLYVNQPPQGLQVLIARSITLPVRLHGQGQTKLRQGRPSGQRAAAMSPVRFAIYLQFSLILTRAKTSIFI